MKEIGLERKYIFLSFLCLCVVFGLVYQGFYRLAIRCTMSLGKNVEH